MVNYYHCWICLHRSTTGFLCAFFQWAFKRPLWHQAFSKGVFILWSHHPLTSLVRKIMFPRYMLLLSLPSISLATPSKETTQLFWYFSALCPTVQHCFYNSDSQRSGCVPVCLTSLCTNWDHLPTLILLWFCSPRPLSVLALPWEFILNYLSASSFSLLQGYNFPGNGMSLGVLV